MHSRGVTIGLLVALLASSGCDKSATSEVAQSPMVDPVSEFDSAASDVEPETILDHGSDSSIEPGSESAESAEVVSDRDPQLTAEQVSEQQVTAEPMESDLDVPPASSEVAEPATSETSPPPEPRFRVLLPTTVGLMLIDVDLVVGNEPLEAAFEQEIAAVLNELGEPSERTWRAFLELVSSDPARFGRSMVEPNQTNNMKRLFDTNRNNRPDRREAAKILFRRSQIDQPFRVYGTDSFRTINRTQSKLIQTLDRNNDRRLDPDEIQRSKDSIERLDENGDGRIEMREVVAAPEANDPAWNRRRSSRWGEVAMDLTGYIDWQMLAYTLEQSDRRGAFGTEPGLVHRIDQDDDDSISAEEARTLRQIEPDIRLRIQFSATTPEIELVELRDALKSLVSVSQSDGQLSLRGESFGLQLKASDLLGRDDLVPAEAFDALDANKDGGLDQDEIPAGVLREFSFEQLDLDNDEKLTLEEIREATRPQRSIWSVQVRARGAESPEAMFAWLDENQDQMLSARELRDLPQRLSRRAGPDGTFGAEQIPDTFVLHFGRSDPDRNEQLFSMDDPNRSRPETTDSRPRWAQAMDSNRDGDIDPLEFIGTPDQFQSLDQDGDGFIDTIEAGGSMSR